MHNTRDILSERLPTLKKVHFIGITSPFSGFVASALLARGVTVTASELRQDTDSAKKWLDKGILFPGGHNAQFITDDLDLIVFPNGAVPGNPEVDETIKRDLNYSYIQELLGVVSRGFKTIAIAGTHGKTTTTAMIIWMLHQTIGTPNFIVGDAKDKIGVLDTNWESHPESPYLVIEACEYKKQFLDRAPNPYISVITHIDLDHTNYYHTQESYNSAFVEFLIPTESAIIIDNKGENEKRVLAQLPAKSTIIKSVDTYRAQFSDIELPLKGKHNQENAIRAAIVGLLMGISEADIRAALKSFPGITARFEPQGKTKSGALIYRDYAHNAAKVAACLTGAHETFPDKKIVAIYQPHNHERTFTSQEQIIKALSLADVIIVPNIYSVRETEEEKNLISAKSFASLIQKEYANKPVIFTDDIAPFTKTVATLQQFDSEYSLFLLMSAGDLEKIIEPLKA